VKAAYRARLLNVERLSSSHARFLIDDQHAAGAIAHGERVCGCATDVTGADDCNGSHEPRVL